MNKDYGLSVWTPEFQDTVVFAARAIVQIARDLRIDVTDAAQLFTTTGHSQGGFEAELVAVLFGVKGTSLDGMGAAGIASQFRAQLNQIMQEEGVGDLIGNHTVGSNDFQTREYTLVGRLQA